VIHVLSTPVLYSLELTPVCNNHCRGCSNVFAEARAAHIISPPLGVVEWSVILDRIAPHAEQLKLTGGEPTLHPEFEAIVRHGSTLGLNFTLFTNARWPDPERLVRFLVDVPQCMGLLISLHGPTASIHEAFTDVPGSFEETVANVRLATLAGLLVATSTVVTRQNHDRIGETVALATAVGADHAVVSRYLGEPLPDLEPSAEELLTAVRTVEDMRSSGRRVRYGDCIPQCFIKNSSTGCLAGVAYCAVDPWGNLRPCNHSPTIAGSLLHQPVETLWRSAAMECWRDLIPAVCHTCAEFSRCHGGCRALVELRPEQRDPLAGLPLTQARPPERVSLHERLRPMRRYRIRQEDFGYVLMRGNRVAPVPFEDKPILDACDGRTTLRQIEHRFGQHGLGLVAALYQKGLLELKPAN
jgi:radical SAM protein with 4Fe4S-binding SPASM domain